jgi:tRNA/rRNA methyltransferase
MQGPVIILVRPQLVENIGTVARAMLNCQLHELRLVSPRDPWPLESPHKERISAASSGADSILENAKIYATTAEAVADLNTVYATTARTRDMIKQAVTPRMAIADTRQRLANDEKVGLMFGPERTGLINDDLQACEKIVSIPANPEFSSFNLAQAVLVLAYEWITAISETPEQSMHFGHTRPATKAELFHLFDHLERELEAGGFFTTEDMKPAMVQNLRNAILRAELTEQEVRTWHGMITALAHGPFKAKNKA